MFYSLENCGSATVRLATLNRARVQSAALAESGSSMESDYAFIKSKPGVADGYLFTVLRWTDIHKIDLSGLPEHQRLHEANGIAPGCAGSHEGGRAAEVAIMLRDNALHR